jgi:hypothetical protein
MMRMRTTSETIKPITVFVRGLAIAHPAIPFNLPVSR